MPRLLLLPLAFVLTAAGCGTFRPVGEGPAPADRESTAAPGDRESTPAPSAAEGTPVVVEHGATVVVDGQPLRFDEVVEDSRCPQGTTCVWAGRATARFTFAEQPVSLTIGTTDESRSSTARVGRHTLTLLALDPYPGSANAEARMRPRATVRVDR
ncbi:MAG TPA: hypothetical protein VD962_12255, partial [Rubricoccaceae bacterium]|nr:hypothetical protein [Rubricoccaceae bacterium]